jgi:hypothetical protein
MQMTSLRKNSNDIIKFGLTFFFFFYILQKDLEQADRMRNTGENLIMDDNYAVDSIRPKCIELQRMCDQYRQLVRSPSVKYRIIPV